MNSCLYFGKVVHSRFQPKKHQFGFRLFMVYLDLDELEDVFQGRWFWSNESFNVATFKRDDYLGPTGVSLKKAVYDLVEMKTGFRPDGPVRMLSHLRYFGYIFNPATFYYCFDSKGEKLEAVVVEITNTPWHQRHAYVVRCTAQSESHHSFKKEFHVSPFLPMDLDYRWSFRVPEEQLGVQMVDLKEGKCLFTASLKLSRKAISGVSLAKALVIYPLITLKVSLGIYLHALILWWKKTPFYSHPDPQSRQSLIRLILTKNGSNRGADR